MEPGSQTLEHLLLTTLTAPAELKCKVRSPDSEPSSPGPHANSLFPTSCPGSWHPPNFSSYPPNFSSYLCSNDSLTWQWFHLSLWLNSTLFFFGLKNKEIKTLLLCYRNTIHCFPNFLQAVLLWAQKRKRREDKQGIKKKKKTGATRSFSSLRQSFGSK